MLPKLRFFYATMGSGKSLQVISANHNFINQGMQTMVFTSAIDTRSGTNKIESRIGINIPAISITKNDNIFEMVKNRLPAPNCVIADEIQFMERCHMWQFSDIVDLLKIPVLLYGLKSDYRGKIFPAAEELFVLSDEIQEIRTVCWCGQGTKMHIKTLDEAVVKTGQQIEVGDANYFAVCRLHWKQGLFENPDPNKRPKKI